MITKGLSCAIALMGLASSATAAPCVGATFDAPLPGALDVKTFISDVPSAQYPAFWQQGTLNGFRYVIYANLEGSLRSTNPHEDWGLALRCDAAAQTCETTPQGTPPEAARTATDTVARCLLGQEPVQEPAEEPTPAPAPEPVTAAAPAPQIEDTPPAPAPCGRALVTEDNDIATLQRLLTMAGQNPGPVDGFLGQQTFTAMQAFVPNAGWSTSVPDTIALVDAFLCQAGGN